MELFEPILHFFEQRWVHNIIWAVILATVSYTHLTLPTILRV